MLPGLLLILAAREPGLLLIPGSPLPLIHAGLDRSMGVGRSGAQRARRRWPHEPRENFFKNQKPIGCISICTTVPPFHLRHRSTVPSASIDRLITC